MIEKLLLATICRSSGKKLSAHLAVKTGPFFEFAVKVWIDSGCRNANSCIIPVENFACDSCFMLFTDANVAFAKPKTGSSNNRQIICFLKDMLQI